MESLALMNYLSISQYKFLIEKIIHYLVSHKEIYQPLRLMNWNIFNFDWMKTDGYAAILMYIMCVIWCKWCISKITSASADIQCYFHFHLFQWLVISYLRKHNRCILSKLFSHQLSNVQMPALHDQMKHYGVKGFALMFNEHGMHLMIRKNIHLCSCNV